MLMLLKMYIFHEINKTIVHTQYNSGEQRHRFHLQSSVVLVYIKSHDPVAILIILDGYPTPVSSIQKQRCPLSKMADPREYVNDNAQRMAVLNEIS